MHRTYKSRVFYIEPNVRNKRENPIDDVLTRMMKYRMEHSIPGIANYSDLNSKGHFTQTIKGYRGVHMTECREYSTNHDCLLSNGMITNSLASFCLAYYRNSIPRIEMEKVIDLYFFYLYGIRKLYFMRWILMLWYYTFFKDKPYGKAPVMSDLIAYIDDDDDDQLTY